MPTTDRHGFELWEAGFTQSDTILNDLLLKLEVKVGASVLDRDLNEPAGGESDGDMYIVGSSPTGAWASFTAGDVVILRESTWYNFTPRRGATAMVEDESNIMVGWTGSAWTTVSVSQAYVDAAVAGLFDHKGGYNASTNTPDLDTSPSGVLKGDVYIVTADGDFFTEPVQIGDTLIADVDSASSLGDWTILESNAPKNNDAATTDPGTGDDDADGYSPGSRWTNVTDDTVWFCLDASTGAAVWQQVESGGGLSQSEVDARVEAVVSGAQSDFYQAKVMESGRAASTWTTVDLATNNKPNLSGWAMSPGAFEQVVLPFVLPPRWDGGEFKIYIHWASSANDTDTFVFQAKIVSTADSAAVVDSTLVGSVTDAYGGANYDIQRTEEILVSASEISTIGLVAGQLNHLIIQSGSGTMTEDAIVLGIDIEWTADAANDD